MRTRDMRSGYTSTYLIQDLVLEITHVPVRLFLFIFVLVDVAVWVELIL